MTASAASRRAPVAADETDRIWETKFRSVVGLSRDAFVEVDGAGVVTEWNRRAEELFGWRADDVVGKPLAEFLVSPGHLDRYEDMLRSARSSPTPSGGDVVGLDEGWNDLRLLHRDGHEMKVGGVAYAAGAGVDLRVGGFVIDLHEHHEHYERREQRGREDAPSRATGYDQLTGLPNRASFSFALARKLEAAPEGQVAVMVLGLDRLTTINDGLGHDAGDDVLIETSKRLSGLDGSQVLVSRLGGDTFLALFSGEDAQADAVSFARKASKAMSLPFELAAGEVFLSASIGIAGNTEGVDRADVVLSNADAAMHLAKRRGGGATEVLGEDVRARVLDRFSTEHSLHRALERRALHVYYQPVVDLSDGSTVAVEALVRWDHPQHGLVLPERFIGVAEESGLIVPIGVWVLEEACRQLAQWKETSRAPLSVEVNVSARQIDHAGLVPAVRRVLAQTGLSGGELTLEITESALMYDSDAARAVLSELKELGVTLAIDDFGTGYSSLAHLQQFPLDVLKVDKTFIDELAAGSDADVIVASVVNLAHSLQLRVV
ncbi:MAG TPA: EAL domain-containing protein, partial [Acidimicrobiales bacterium]|nr:EAL domain-containing protein [Acidimicrobiales bacterium]